ncbi:MAG: hypothetical protein WDA75_00840 [Candidatus Latescibacterota bacterium]
MLRGVLFSAFVAVLAGSAHGVQVNGRLTSSLSTYEGQATDGTSATYARVHQGLSLDASDLGSSSLSFHTYLRGSTDLAESAETDPSLRLFSAYLAWRKVGHRVLLGRQYVQAGVGRGSIDGVRADLTFKVAKLTLFAGPLAPRDGDAELGAWSDGNLWGARIGSKRLWSTDLALSVARLERKPWAYAGPGRYSGTAGSDESRVQTLAGLDLGRQSRAGHGAYLRLEYDGEAQVLRRAETSGRWVISPRTVLEAEWLRREPTILTGSVFSVFPSSPYQEFGVRVHLTARPGLRLHGHLATVLLDGDSAQRLGLTVDLAEGYSLGYYRTMGYARLSDGVVGSVWLPLGRQWVLQGHADLTAYERDETSGGRDEAAAAGLGLNYRPSRALGLEADLQAVRNPQYAFDTRLFLRATWSFFKRGDR